MKTAVCFASIIFSLCASQVCAQMGGDRAATSELSASGLPNGPQEPIHGLVPGAGPTPGVIISAESPATQCSRDAARAADGLMTANDAVASCNAAITSPVLTRQDLAGTFVNRGVLLLTMSEPRDAMADFDRALALEPDLAEAFVNRAIILLAEGKPQAALADLDRGIALQPGHPERAYYHRGLAREDLKDFKGAYADYKAADALKPGWEPVAAELNRFKVRTSADQ
jgi:tetratricopeptide (TPR) repeat protein